MITYQKKKRHHRSFRKIGLSNHFKHNSEQMERERNTKTYHFWLQLSVYAVPVGITRKNVLDWPHEDGQKILCFCWRWRLIVCRTKGKLCAQHVFLMKASEQRRTAVLYHRTSETKKWEWQNREERGERAREACCKSLWFCCRFLHIHCFMTEVSSEWERKSDLKFFFLTNKVLNYWVPW